MKIDSIELREIALDLVAPFETSFGRTTARRIILVKVDAEGLSGWGECTAPEGPFFNEEFVDGAWEAIQRFVAPTALSEPLVAPEEFGERLGRVRGNRMARAAVEAAIWQLFALADGEPLWRYLGGTNEVIECGVSIGLQPNVEALLEKVDTELASGYRRIKIKIAPGRDLALVRAVRETFGAITLSVDANSAYSADDEVLRELDEFKLLMIEQPLRPGDLLDHAKLQAKLVTPICLDESIVDDESARQALEIGACRIVNIKLGRVGGHTEARKIADRCFREGIPVWCGGMLESGVGRLHNAAMSANPAFALPGDVSDSRRYWDRDVVMPRPTVRPDGTMLLSETSGIGAEIDEKFLESITLRRALLSG